MEEQSSKSSVHLEKSDKARVSGTHKAPPVTTTKMTTQKRTIGGGSAISSSNFNKEEEKKGVVKKAVSVFVVFNDFIVGDYSD
jgi:hypothetical protein